MELRADSRAITTGRKRGASNAADGSVGKRVIVCHPVIGKGFDSWRRSAMCIEMFQEVDRVTFGNKPDNIRAIGGPKRADADQRRDKTQNTTIEALRHRTVLQGQWSVAGRTAANDDGCEVNLPVNQRLLLRFAAMVFYSFTTLNSR